MKALNTALLMSNLLWKVSNVDGLLLCDLTFWVV